MEIRRPRTQRKNPSRHQRRLLSLRNRLRLPSQHQIFPTPLLGGGTTETLNLAKKSIKDIDVKGKRVLMRCDFNVPLDKTTGAITNNQRILGAIPTIEYALESDAKAVILLSHMGRPNGFPSVLFPLSFL